MRWWVAAGGTEIAQKEGLLHKTGTRPLCAICLNKWSSHCSSQGCVWVGSWGGGTVLRYWGSQHQNHTFVHPLWSLKPHCQVHFWKMLREGLRVQLCGADTSTSQGQLLWPDIAADRKNRFILVSQIKPVNVRGQQEVCHELTLNILGLHCIWAAACAAHHFCHRLREENLSP